MKLSVCGLGYLGIVQAVTLCDLGHEVMGIDPDSTKVNKLRKGEMPLFEPGAEDLLKRGLDSGRLTFTNEFSDSLRNCGAHFICVGTPWSDENNSINLEFVFGVATSLAKFANPNSLVIGKSTVPVGTARRVQSLLIEELGNEVGLIWNPEFLREGSAVRDSMEPDRIVIGSDDEKSMERYLEIFSGIVGEGRAVVRMGLESAELCKVASNAFLATKLSFMNAVAEICELSGADVLEVAKAMSYDERIGKSYLKAGIGYGGGCLPKDLKGFSGEVGKFGLEHAGKLFEAVREVNDRSRERAVKAATSALDHLEGKKILVLGVSFKAGSDDIRESPSLDLALSLAIKGALVTLHDPVAIPKVKGLGLPPNITLSEESAVGASKGQDLVVLGTDWPEYLDLDPVSFGDAVNAKKILDARNSLNVSLWQSHGWRVIAMGRNI